MREEFGLGDDFAIFVTDALINRSGARLASPVEEKLIRGAGMLGPGGPKGG